MDKFFDIIKKLRPGVQSGKVSREQALAELMQESGVSEDIAGSAVTKMMPSSGGITTLPEAEVLDVSFKPGMDKRGKVVEESPSQGSGFANIDPDILSLGQKDRFEYEMAKYKQERSKRMQPFYKKYGAQSEKDKELVDELYEYNLEGEFVPSKGNPKYINNSARTFMQESVEDIPGVVEDLVLDILYSKESERFLKNQGVDNYINYVQTRFKEIGLNFNKPLLKRFLKYRYGPEEFSVGGRVGFKDGVGRKGILSALKDKLNEIAPGSTAVGKATKAVSDKAKRAAAERELTQDFNKFNKKFPAEGDSFKDRQARLINDYPILKDETKLQQAVDDIYPSGDYKYDAEMAADALVENNPDIFNNLLREDLPEELSSEIYGAVLRPITNNMAKQMQLKKATRPEKTLASIKEGKGINISDPEIADEFGRFMKETDPEGYKELEQKVELSNFDTKGRKKNARGGLNYLMGLQMEIKKFNDMKAYMLKPNRLFTSQKNTIGGGVIQGEDLGSRTGFSSPEAVEYLKTLEPGTTVNTYEIGKKFNIAPATVRGQVERNFPNLKLDPSTHSAVFVTIHKEGNFLQSPKAIEKFLAKFGVAPEVTSQYLNSFSVKQKVNRGIKYAKQVKVTAVPMMIVDGTYIIESKGTFTDMLKVVDYVVELQRPNSQERNEK